MATKFKRGKIWYVEHIRTLQENGKMSLAEKMQRQQMPNATGHPPQADYFGVVQ